MPTSQEHTNTIIGISGAIGAVVAVWLTARYTDRREAKNKTHERIETLRALYEDCLAGLELAGRKEGMGTDEDEEKTVRILARLDVSAPPEIRAQYSRAAEALGEWAELKRQSGPQKVTGGWIISSDRKDNTEKLDVLWQTFEQERDALKEFIQNDLAGLYLSKAAKAYKAVTQRRILRKRLLK